MSSDWVVLSPAVGIAAAEVLLLIDLLVG
jgi:hypothetical protein